MPAKFWDKAPDGKIEGSVRARGSQSNSPFEFTLATQLDEAIDRMLDSAVDLMEQAATAGSAPQTKSEATFLKWWSVGAAMIRASIRDEPALEGEEPEFLDQVLANKFRVGVRSDGTETKRWLGLRPDDRGDDRRRNREGSEKGFDHWAMCMWIAEQPYEEARKVFGGSIRNVWQMLERSSLRPLVLRRALLVVFSQLPDALVSELTSTSGFPELMKTLRTRWPGRGKRSARQPVHYDEASLVKELQALIAVEPS